MEVYLGRQNIGHCEIVRMRDKACSVTDLRSHLEKERDSSRAVAERPALTSSH